MPKEDNISQQPIVSNEDPLYFFLDSCLWDKGIREVPPEIKEKMIADLADRLQSWLLQATVKELSEKDAKDMEKLLDKGALQAEVTAFLKSRISNLDDIYKQAMESFKQAYLAA